MIVTGEPESPRLDRFKLFIFRLKINNDILAIFGLTNRCFTAIALNSISSTMLGVGRYQNVEQALYVLDDFQLLHQFDFQINRSLRQELKVPLNDHLSELQTSLD